MLRIAASFFLSFFLSFFDKRNMGIHFLIMPHNQDVVAVVVSLHACPNVYSDRVFEHCVTNRPTWLLDRC